MANRVQEDLKLIVGIDDTLNGNIPSHAPKDSIPGKRGIVYFNADGSSSATSGNTPGVDDEGNKEEGTTQPGADGASGGTSGGGANGGNSTADAGVEDPYPVDDSTQTGSGIFDVDQMTLGDIVNGVTGLKDCSTGNPVDVRFDGQFTAPDGWSDPDTGSLPADYEAGFYWGAKSGGNQNQYGPTREIAAVRYGVTRGSGCSTHPYSFYAVDPADYGATSGDIAYFYDCSSGFATTGFISYGRFSCGSDPAGEQTAGVCEWLDESTIVATEWPSEKPMQLSYNRETGLYETHPMDKNVTTDYSQPVSSFALCNQNGDPIKSYPTADGGQAIHNETTGVTTFIDSTGKVTGFGDAQAITNNLPR